MVIDPGRQASLVVRRRSKMEVTLFWPVLGALIGVAAAQRNGFNVVGGVLGGLLLGPLAVLMFFVSGIASREE